MTTLARATRLFAAAAALCAVEASIALAQGPVTPTTTTVTGPSSVRPEFTRPAGIPGSARTIAASDQYMLAPGQPGDPAAPKRRKRR
jgi:hypothetical protein